MAAQPIVNLIRSQYPEAPESVVAWAVASGGDYRGALRDCADKRALMIVVGELASRAMRVEGPTAFELFGRVYRSVGYEVNAEATHPSQHIVGSDEEYDRLTVDQLRARMPLDELLRRAGLT